MNLIFYVIFDCKRSNMFGKTFQKKVEVQDRIEIKATERQC